MKKLLALLLAMLMPFSAMADTYGLSLSIKTEEASFIQLVKEALRQEPALSDMDLDKLAAAMEQILDGIGFKLAVQEDAAALDIQLGGMSLLDLAVHLTQDAVCMTTSLLPGYVLLEELDAPTDAEQALADEFASTDWQAVADSVTAAIEQWSSVIEPTVSRGVFSGDAFEYGTSCTTWVLSDMDIAALVSAVLTDEMRSALISVLTIAGADADHILTQIDNLNDKVADEDVYIYMLRVAENDAGDVIGLSLTIIQELSQVATISLGLGAKEIRLVVGLGVKENNYWWEFSGKRTEVSNVTYFSGSSREWMADKSEAFPFVKTHEEPVSNYEWRCSLTQSGKRYLWDGRVNVWTGQACEVLCASSGVFVPGTGNVSGTLSLGAAPNEPLKLSFSCGPVEAIADLDENAVICNLTDPADAELSMKLQNQLSSALLARLIKKLPMELLLSMPQIRIPE